MIQKKVILISIDGMRPDGFLSCGNPFIEDMMKNSWYSLDATNVFPTVTLPCHMSMFHSVPPERHGITTNIYLPMARPLPGLFEQLNAAKAVCAMYWGWPPLQDIHRPASVKFGELIQAYTEESSDTSLTDAALARIAKSHPDFVFLYMVETDEKGGHDSGWMTEEYLRRISIAIDNVKRVLEACSEEYTIVVTSDHGGHDRSHGTTMPEDSTIPMFFFGDLFPKGEKFSGGSILDIAPTIVDIMGVDPADEWEGKSLLQK